MRPTGSERFFFWCAMVALSVLLVSAFAWAVMRKHSPLLRIQPPYYETDREPRYGGR